MLNRRKVHVAGLQEMRYKNYGTRMIKGDKGIHKLFWSGNRAAEGGIGIMVAPIG